MKVVDYSKVFPIQSIEDGYLINGNGDVTVGFALFLPEAFTKSDEESFSLYDSLVALIKRLPPGTIFHQQSFYYTGKYHPEYVDGDSYTTRKNKMYYDCKPVIRSYTNLYLTFRIGIKGRSRDAFSDFGDYLFKRPFKDVERVIREIGVQVSNVENSLRGLKSQGFGVVRMDNEKLGCALYDYFSLSYAKPADSFEDKVLQPMIANENYVKIGETYVSIVSLIEEGGSLEKLKIPKTADGGVYGDGIEYNSAVGVKTSMAYAIGMGLPFGHVLNTFIEVTDNEEMLAECASEKKELNTLAMFPSGAKEKQVSLQKYIDTITEQNFQTSRTGVNVIVHDSNLDVLNSKIGFIKDAFGNMNDSKCWVENKDAGRLFFSSAPGNIRSNDRKFINAVHLGVCYLPKETHYTSDPEGFLYVDRFGNPVVVNILNNSHIVNKNVVVFAPSGSGKTHFIQTFLDGCISMDNEIILINVKPDYVKHAEINGGLYFDTVREDQIGFNPFYTQKDEDGKWKVDIGLQSYLVYTIERIWKDTEVLNYDEKAILEKYIDHYYRDFEGDIPSIDSFFEYSVKFEKALKKEEAKFLDFVSLRLALDRFYTGKMKAFFHPKKEVDVYRRKYVLYDLMGVKGNDMLFDIYLYYILQVSTERIIRNHARGVFTNIIVEEAVDHMKGKAGDFIGEQYRKIRSLNGSILIATQGISYLDSVDPLVKQSIINNSDIRVLLDHSRAQNLVPILQKELSLRNYNVEQLNSLEQAGAYREFLLLMGNKALILRNQVSPETNAVYTTTDKEVKAIQKIFDKVGSLPAAIELYEEEKQQQLELAS